VDREKLTRAAPGVTLGITNVCGSDACFGSPFGSTFLGLPPLLHQCERQPHGPMSVLSPWRDGCIDRRRCTHEVAKGLRRSLMRRGGRLHGPDLHQRRRHQHLTVVHTELARTGRVLRLAHASPFLVRMLDVLQLTHLLVPDSVAAPPRQSRDDLWQRQLFSACADTHRRARLVAAEAAETVQTSKLVREQLHIRRLRVPG
jgi:hypothetical protein